MSKPGKAFSERDWIHRLDRRLLALRRHLKWKLGILEPLRIDVYLSYAGTKRALIRGRALENRLPSRPGERDTAWDNLRRSIRQLESDEVPGLCLEVQFAGQRQTVITDDEGYFFATLELEQPPEPGWNPVLVQVVDSSIELARGVYGTGAALVPSEDALFGVISDIDDTILQSHVQNRFRQAQLTLLGNAITRLSFQGTKELYRGLESGGNGAPFFYVSRSAWSIHAVLEHFIAHQGLPHGPLLLRHVGLFTKREVVRGHKQREIERILSVYPHLSFVLIGDSGQRDTSIYVDLASQYPGRVRAILIRDVSSAERVRQVATILETRCPKECPWLIFEDDREAARFCGEKGLLANELAAD